MVAHLLAKHTQREFPSEPCSASDREAPGNARVGRLHNNAGCDTRKHRYAAGYLSFC
jgi:hypothetical protein